MSVVVDAREPSARYLEAVQPALVRQFGLLATAPGGVARLRELILTLAVQGKLVPQEPTDKPAAELLRNVKAEKSRLVNAGRMQRERTSPEVQEGDQPFELPRGWAWVSLPEITYDLGQGPPVEAFTYIDVAAIDNERAVVTEAVQVIQPADAPSRARKRVSVGTVIYSTVRPYLKNIAIVEKPYTPSAIVSTAFAVMHPHDGIDAKYLLHYLRSAVFTEFVAGKMAGVAYPAINDSNFFSGVIALPPTSEQARIVARVDELMRLCDALEAKGRLAAEQHARLLGTLLGTLTDSSTPEELAANWQRLAAHFDLLLDRPEAVDALEQTILQLAVRGLLVPQVRSTSERHVPEALQFAGVVDEVRPFDIPRTWRWCRFSDALDFQGGSQPPKSRFSESPREGYVRLVQIRDLGGKPQPIFVAKGDVSKFCSADDVMVGRYGASVGKVFWGIEGAYNVALVKLIDLRSNFDRRFLHLLLSSPLGQSWFRGISRSAQDGFNKNDIGPNWTPVPPLIEQGEIVARVTELRRLCADLRQRLTASQTIQSHLAEALVESAIA